MRACVRVCVCVGVHCTVHTQMVLIKKAGAKGGVKCRCVHPISVKSLPKALPLSTNTPPTASIQRRLLRDAGDISTLTCSMLCCNVLPRDSMATRRDRVSLATADDIMMAWWGGG